MSPKIESLKSSCLAQATYVKNHLKEKKEIKETEKKLKKITESCKTLESKSTVDLEILGIIDANLR